MESISISRRMRSGVVAVGAGPSLRASWLRCWRLLSPATVGLLKVAPGDHDLGIKIAAGLPSGNGVPIFRMYVGGWCARSAQHQKIVGAEHFTRADRT